MRRANVFRNDVTCFIRPKRTSSTRSLPFHSRRENVKRVRPCPTVSSVTAPRYLTRSTLGPSERVLLDRFLAACPQAQHVVHESDLVRVVKRAFNGTFSPMMQFLVESEKLSDEEVRYVEDLLKQRKRRKAGSKKS